MASNKINPQTANYPTFLTQNILLTISVSLRPFSPSPFSFKAPKKENSPFKFSMLGLVAILAASSGTNPDEVNAV